MGEDRRVRGRKAQTIRKRRLANEPLCRHCDAAGRVTAATVPDHIVPLSQGGTDDESNIQCLCETCHATKTATDLGYAPRVTIGADGWPVE